MKKESCKKTIKHNFLFWSWTDTEYEHDWSYINTKERKCIKCGQKEILFGIRQGLDHSFEDWRKTQ